MCVNERLYILIGQTEGKIMGIITTQDIKEIVRKFGKSSIGDGDWYFIIKKEFVDGIRDWLDDYIYGDDDEGQWLGYTLIESKNETEVYILRLYAE